MFYVIGKCTDGTEYRVPARNMARLSLALTRQDPDHMEPHTIEGTIVPMRLPAMLREYLEGHPVTYRVICNDNKTAEQQQAEQAYNVALARLQTARTELAKTAEIYSALYRKQNSNRQEEV